MQGGDKFAVVEKALDTRPALMSASALAKPASMIWRCLAVYSSSATGGFGKMLITPPETLNSISWPFLRPACRRTAGGTTSGVLFLTVTVMVGSTLEL